MFFEYRMVAEINFRQDNAAKEKAACDKVQRKNGSG